MCQISDVGLSVAYMKSLKRSKARKKLEGDKLGKKEDEVESQREGTVMKEIAVCSGKRRRLVH